MSRPYRACPLGRDSDSRAETAPDGTAGNAQVQPGTCGIPAAPPGTASITTLAAATQRTRPSEHAEDAVFRPVRAGNAFEETVERMLQAIRLGVVGPGGRLPSERELSTRLGVSRVTLREALRVLQESGYVECRRGRYGGTFVRADLPEGGFAEPPIADLEDVLTLRRVLETGAAEAAASRALTPQDRRHLRACLDDCARVRGTADYRRRDSRLHLAIAETAAAPSLTAGLADVRSRLNALLDTIPLIPANIDHSDRQHHEIVAAILHGDPLAARQAMAEHVDGTASLLRGFLA